MTRHRAVAIILAALCATAAAALARGAWTDAIAAAKAEERTATLADVQAALSAQWGAQRDAMLAGMDTPASIQQATPEGNGQGLLDGSANPSEAPNSSPEAVAPEASELPAWMPDTIAAWWGLIVPAAERHAVDPALVSIVMLVESAGNPAARSSAGAASLLQVMPATGSEVAQRLGMGPSPDLFDPAVSIELGTAYLAECLGRFGRAADAADDWGRSVELAAACFNGGPGGAARYRDGNPHDETELYGGLVIGMWRERKGATSATFDHWVKTWGRGAIERAREVLLGMGVLAPGEGGTMGISWRPHP